MAPRDQSVTSPCPVLDQSVPVSTASAAPQYQATAPDGGLCRLCAATAQPPPASSCDVAGRRSTNATRAASATLNYPLAARYAWAECGRRSRQPLAQRNPTRTTPTAAPASTHMPGGVSGLPPPHPRATLCFFVVFTPPAPQWRDASGLSLWAVRVVNPAETMFLDSSLVDHKRIF